jgi:AraC family ethanolamine operon transcriptional activator
MRGLDPEMLIHAISGARYEPCLLSSRCLPSEYTRLLLPQTCLDFATIGPALLVTGELAPNCFTLLYPLACPTPGRNFRFGLNHATEHVALFPPGAILDAATPEGYESVAFTVPTPVFEAAAALHFPEIPQTFLERGGALHIGSAVETRLRDILIALRTATLYQPEEISHPASLVAIEQEVLAEFLAALRGGFEYPSEITAHRRGLRVQRFHRAREYIAAHLHQPIYLGDLCAEVGLTQRGMENLFSEELGISPFAYLRRQRLHGVRRTLLNTVTGTGVIKRVALEWGYWHLGRFAKEYRQLFGESPRETLARPR